ncbi:2-succinyl-5-enolpyruvyl-6-hydroxy-3-cyclohexene-1-carboxylate synthase [Sediminicola sp. YIK13]|uniref:2-succinyl-5-enolpyruvyl-6-hydroxy-3- cyclohexene-1-carboxylic-acid synthase n=1 Tax=Sediminicola sp. YIK13 TaxID=1453352 RepID=UPI00071F33CF|nr:2-succinyl-5-enolpyruvyl-6-hydroxy-3-cyclohexene-1-carboxylic-acid synthase [Sediminicola sp. YIK13]ALM07238.1 2-succinyl-5-enolpyruvyl-6-hydroxy-3-cyclohexene-1-carboxylate synthase [Sediminicola sp. YIK13]
MKYSSIPSAQTVVSHCKANGINNIVISPGSRNAPLTIGFSEDPSFNCYSVVDERCAAFFALGIAQQSKKPVALLCSSGSALLNYYPAIAEAYYSDIPLVVITADRPPHKIDIGDGQTIRQENVFQNHIGYSANLKLDIRNTNAIGIADSEGSPQASIQEYNEEQLLKAFTIVFQDKVPVHINVPFEEPLYGVVEKPMTSTIGAVIKEQESLLVDDLDHFTQLWNTAKRKMILVGVHDPSHEVQQLLDSVANDPSVIVFTETTSNLHHPNFFGSIDSIIAPIEKSKNKEKLFEELRPEILLTFGGLIVSKKIKAFLRKFTPEQHWHIDPKKANNTFFCLSYHFRVNPLRFFEVFNRGLVAPPSNYFSFWERIKKGYQVKRQEYMEQIPFSDMLAFYHIFKNIPIGYQLQLANSSTIRYAQLFDLDPSLHVFCNRGTSGIDGSTSTAIGASIIHKDPTLFISGDLSFFYDSNALWNNHIRPDFRIIVLNNEGGGIFRILPGQEDTQNFETYFETVHQMDASHLCKMYQMEYQMAENEQELGAELTSFFGKSDKPKLLEIKTPRVLNNKILLSYFDFIS